MFALSRSLSNFASASVAGIGFAFAALGICSTAPAQISYTEPPDLNGQSVGTAAVGVNTITGALSVIITSTIPPTALGDDVDAFSFTVPVGTHVTSMSLSITNLAGTGQSTSNPAVYFSSLSTPTYVYCSAANNLTFPIAIPTTDARLGPGTYTLQILTGKSVADGAGSRSFNYVLRFQSETETGACCNRWTGACTSMTPAVCASVGLRYNGAFSTCSPSACQACPADFNGTSGLGVQDIFDFLAAWFTGC